MVDKVHSLKDAISMNVADGFTVFVGGFGQCIPFAAAHEIIRQGKKDLVLCRSGADILFDLLIAAGCVRKVIVGYLGNPGVGLAHAFRRALKAGEIEIEDWTNFSMVLRLHAAALGIPFIPTATLVGGDVPTGSISVSEVVCPYTHERLTAVPALEPDVAIVHAQYADRAGNVQLHSLSGETQDGALASRKIIATVERIVPTDRIHAQPERTLVPGFRVAAVCEVPWGAYPSYVAGFYGRDDEFYFRWDRLSRDAADLAGWIDREIRARPTFGDFVKELDPSLVKSLDQSGVHSTNTKAQI